MSGKSLAELIKCRDASVLLDACKANDDGDDEIRDLFFAPGLVSRRSVHLRRTATRAEAVGRPSVPSKTRGPRTRRPAQVISNNSTRVNAGSLRERQAVEPDAASSSNLKNEGKEDLVASGAMPKAGTNPIDCLIASLEEKVRLSKQRLAELEASQAPEEPPLDAAL
ncbi:hypothetical protein MTO96_006299 [Rhipicephalus appendiculatus]